MRTATGNSVAALANSTISGIAWTAYGVAEHEVWVALPALVALPATAGALVLAWSRGGSRARLWLPVLWLVTILVATALVPWVGAAPITVVLGCSVALMITPAALTAWRSHDVSAIAASAWAMLIVDALAILARIGIPAHVHARLVPLLAGVDPDVVRDDLGLAA